MWMLLIDYRWSRGLLVAPILLRLADVGLVAELSHALSLGEELLGLVGISLLDGEVTNLAEQEVVEVLPVRLLGVERERVLAFLSQSWVVAPQVPGLELARFARRRTALHGLVPSQRHSVVSGFFPSPQPGSCPYRPWPSDRG